MAQTRRLTWVLVWSNSETISAREVEGEREMSINQPSTETFLDQLEEDERSLLAQGILIRIKIGSKSWRQHLKTHEVLDR
ncbi:MAG: hypothetical protein AAGF01_23815 [Cyanobacteria bacterium P01_G01_bin.38]